MERKLYMSLGTAEELALNPSNTPDLQLLLTLHSQLTVDITEQELEAQETDADSLLTLLHQQIGSFKYNAVPAWQQNLNTVIGQDAAGTLFVLDHDTTTCEQISKQYGVCAISQQTAQIAHYLVRPLGRKELVTTNSYGATTAGQMRQGWHAVLTIPELMICRAPVNALIITDTYLFGDRGRFVADGKANLIGLLQALLPPTLDIDFHLLLVAANTQVPFTDQTFATFSTEMESALAKPYRIKIGMVTRKHGGKDRRSITGNYYFCTSQHGFACFKNARLEYNNDFVANGAFEGADSPGVDIPARSMSTELKTAKKLLVDNRLREAAPGSNVDPERRNLGFCDNRLLSLV